MDPDQLADAAGRGGSGVGGRLDRADVAADDRGDETGVDLDYENVGQSGGMLMVSASGTAVVFE